MTKGKHLALMLAFFISFGFLNLKLAHAATELARVNGSVITLEEFNKKYRDVSQFFPLHLPAKKEVLNDLVNRELGVQEAKRAGLERDPEVIDQMNAVLFNALLRKKLSKEVESLQVSDEDAKRYYEKNPEIRTSHIFVALSPAAKEEERKKAFEKITKIQGYLADGKKGFAEIAQQYSEGPAASMGGDLGYQTRERMDPHYYEAALKLHSSGKITEAPVRTNFGYHLIKLTAIRSWEEADQAQAKRMAFEEHKNKVFEKYMVSLKNQNKVAIHSDLLN